MVGLMSEIFTLTILSEILLIVVAKMNIPTNAIFLPNDHYLYAPITSNECHA